MSNSNTRYPFVHQIASANSKKNKILYFVFWAGYLISLILAAIIDSFFKNPVAVFVVFLISVILIVILKFFDFQSLWMKNRSIAELVKGVTWKWISKASPYNKGNTADESEFQKDIEDILMKNSKLLNTTSESNQVFTDYMNEKRALNFTNRYELYKTERAENQINWYKKEVLSLKRRRRIALIVFCLLNLVTIGFMIYGVEEKQFRSTSELLTMASTIMAWSESRHYKELINNYSFASHRITISLSKTISNSSDFERLVEEVESVLSEEQKKWLLNEKTMKL